MAPPKSSRKRKDAPSPPVSPQSSKQQQLLEARSQAKAWADAKRDQKKQTIISPVNHSKVAAVESAAKRPKTESAAKRPKTESAAKRPKTEDEDVKKSKKEVLREARERAAAWAEETANLKKASSTQQQQQQHDESLPEVPPAYRALVASQLRHATATIDSNNNQQQQQQEKLSVLEEQQRQLLERQKRLHQQRLSFLEEQQKIQQPPQQQRHDELRQSEQESLRLQQKLFEERQKLLEEEHRHSLEEQRRQEERERLQEQEHYERRLLEEKQHQQRLLQQNEALQQRLKQQTLSNTDTLQTSPYSTQTQQQHNRLDQQRQLHHEQQHTLQRETQILQHRLRDNKPDTQQHTAEPFPDTFYDTKSTPFPSLKQEEQEHSLHYSSTLSTLWDTLKEMLPFGCKFVGLMLLFFFLIAIVYLVILSTSPFWAPTATSSKQMLLLGNGDKRSEPLTPPPPPPCFKTEGFAPPFSESWSCLNPVDPCPEHGRCQNGILVDCNLGVNEIGETYPPTLFFNGNILTLYVVQNGDRCVPSSFCAELMEGLKTKVVDLTVEQACTLWSNCSIQREYIGKRIVAEDDDNGDGPLFASNGIANLLDLESTDVIGQLVREVNKNITLPHDTHMLTLLPPEDAKTVDHHHLMRKNVTVSSSWIGLTPYYMTKKLSIPFFCYMRLLLWDITLSLLSVIVSFTQGILCAFYRVGRAYPIVTILTFLILYVGRWIQVRRSSRAKLRERVHSVRELVNEKLVLDCDEGEGYAVLHLRDELCMELHPSSVKERDVFHHQVWPRVVLEVRGDNRIQKSNKAVGGKMLEYWIWVANTARKNRRLHRTHHPNGTPSKLRQ